jgi:hypothetical protein
MADDNNNNVVPPERFARALTKQTFTKIGEKLKSGEITFEPGKTKPVANDAAWQQRIREEAERKLAGEAANENKDDKGPRR